MKRNLIGRYEILTDHISEIIDLIQYDCKLMLDENYENQDYVKGISHIQGLCNGLKKHIDNIKK